MYLSSAALSVSADAKEEAERTMGWGSVAVWAIMALLLFWFCVVAVVLPLLDGTSSKENVLATPSRNDEACRRTRVRNICLGNTNHSYFILPSFWNFYFLSRGRFQGLQPKSFEIIFEDRELDRTATAPVIQQYISN